MTALVVGSMAPDFEFFIRLQPVKQSMEIPFGHTISGMFLYDLPLCFLFAWIFHAIIKTPLLTHLPKPFDQRYSQDAWQKWTMDLRSFIVFCYSAILAMVIHIILDSFTHLNSPMVHQVSYLFMTVNIFGYSIPVCKLLDHIGTVVGLFVVMAFLYSYNCTASTGFQSAISASRQIAYFAAILGSGIINAIVWLYRYGKPLDSSEIAGPIIAFISGLAIGTTVGWQLVRL